MLLDHFPQVGACPATKVSDLHSSRQRLTAHVDQGSGITADEKHARDEGEGDGDGGDPRPEDPVADPRRESVGNRVWLGDLLPWVRDGVLLDGGASFAGKQGGEFRHDEQGGDRYYERNRGVS